MRVVDVPAATRVQRSCLELERCNVTQPRDLECVGQCFATARDAAAAVIRRKHRLCKRVFAGDQPGIRGGYVVLVRQIQ